jgi:hypothetical protein
VLLSYTLIINRSWNLKIEALSKSVLGKAAERAETLGYIS